MVKLQCVKQRISITKYYEGTTKKIPINILGTIHNATISELKKQILILENKKCEIKDNLFHTWKMVNTLML